jgi:hypothetical protein
MCPGILPPGLVGEGLSVLPWGPPKPPNTVQMKPIFKHDVVLCYWGGGGHAPDVFLCSSNENSTEPPLLR